MSQRNLYGTTAYDRSNLPTASLLQARAALLREMLPGGSNTAAAAAAAAAAARMRQQLPQDLGRRGGGGTTRSMAAPDPPGEHVGTSVCPGDNALKRGLQKQQPVVNVVSKVIAATPPPRSRPSAFIAPGVSFLSTAVAAVEAADAAAAAAAAAAKRNVSPDDHTHPAGPATKKARRTATTSATIGERSWDEYFGALVSFHARQRHSNITVDNHPEDPELAIWVRDQRARKIFLTTEQRYKLDLVGFWKDGATSNGASGTLSSVAYRAAAPLGRAPEQAHSIFAALEQYKQRHPAPAHPMARETKARQLSLPQHQDLNGGDVMKKDGTREEKEPRRKRVRSFEENFEALLEYKKEYGNCDVPQKRGKLGIWVKNVRQHPNRFTEDQRKRLDAIGFKWRKLQLDGQWNDAFNQLVQYRDKYGDCNVPSRWKKSPALARWVHTQRTMYRRDKLLEDRKDKLEAAGFVWDCNAMREDEAFHENYEKLVEYKRAHGHCNVPSKYRKDRPLGRWAAKMRELYACEELDADRLKALNGIVFVWKSVASGGGHGSAEGSQSSDTESDSDDEESDQSVLI